MGIGLFVSIFRHAVSCIGREEKEGTFSREVECFSGFSLNALLLEQLRFLHMLDNWNFSTMRRRTGQGVLSSALFFE